MSSIPLLGGLTAVVAAATLTGMVSVDLQLQDRRVAIEAEGLALAIAEAAGLPATAAAPAAAATPGAPITTSLQEQLAIWLPAFQTPSDPISFAAATSADGATVEVRVCHRAKVWALPWLDAAFDRSQTGAVCALGRARPIN